MCIQCGETELCEFGMYHCCWDCLYCDVEVWLFGEVSEKAGFNPAFRFNDVFCEKIVSLRLVGVT